jgi:hypothetical protein
MSRKLLTSASASVLINKIELFKSIPTWTKQKHAEKKALISYIKARYKYSIIEVSSKAKDLKQDRYYTWDYESKTITTKSRGRIRDFLNKKVFIICLNIYQYGNRELMIIPFNSRDKTI